MIYYFKRGATKPLRQPRGPSFFVRLTRLLAATRPWRAWLASLSFGEESLVDGGQCKSIGLSDIGLEKLREVVAAARINEGRHAWSHSSGQLS
jgi:hypothetical protein